MSNYSAWYELLTKLDAPTWMESTSADYWGSRIFGAFSILCFLWFFWQTPWWKKIWPRSKISGENEAEDEFVRGFNHATSHRVSTKDEALLHLARLRTEGLGIRNSASDLYYTGNLDGWSQKVIEWMTDVIGSLKPLSSADSEWFATLDVVPRARVPIPNVRLGRDRNNEFHAIFNQHDYRLVRLEDLLKKYGAAA